MSDGPNTLVLALALLALPLSGCSSISLGAGLGYDAGTIGVSGVETGTGRQFEVLGYARSGANRYGIGPAFEIAGFSTGGEADPIAFTTIELRYRRDLGGVRDRGLYAALGTGLGAAWSPDIDRLAVPLQAELGYQIRAGRALLSLGARERLLPLVGTGSPPFDVFNSIQLVGGVGLVVDPERR